METSVVLTPEDFLPYYQMVANVTTPAKLLLRALALIATEKPAPTAGALAVDLGCGTGKDTVELLRRQWQVLAVDFSQTAIDTLLQRPEATQYKALLETRVASFSQTNWSGATLVMALLSLPYCPDQEFAGVWQSLVSSLVPGGYFVGQLFGPEHLQGQNHIVRRSKSEIDSMLAGFQVLHLEEVKQAVEKAEDGSDLYYHFFDIIARIKT